MLPSRSNSSAEASTAVAAVLPAEKSVLIWSLPFDDVGRFSVAIDEDTSVNFPMPTFAVPASTASATLFVVAKNPAPLTTALLLWTVLPDIVIVFIDAPLTVAPPNSWTPAETVNPPTVALLTFIVGLVKTTSSLVIAVLVNFATAPRFVTVAPCKLISAAPLTNFCPLRFILLLYTKVFEIDVSAFSGKLTSIEVPPKMCVWCTFPNDCVLADVKLMLPPVNISLVPETAVPVTESDTTSFTWKPDVELA